MGYPPAPGDYKDFVPFNKPEYYHKICDINWNDQNRMIIIGYSDNNLLLSIFSTAGGILPISLSSRFRSEKLFCSFSTSLKSGFRRLYRPMTLMVFELIQFPRFLTNFGESILRLQVSIPSERCFIVTAIILLGIREHCQVCSTTQCIIGYKMFS